MSVFLFFYLQTGLSMAKKKTISLFRMIANWFDEAAKTSNVHPELLERIKTCYSVYHCTFPVKQDDGTQEIIHGWQATFHRNDQPIIGGLRYAMTVNEDEILSLAFLTLMQIALFDLPFGSTFCGIKISKYKS